jgi:hypothetical protein
MTQVTQRKDGWVEGVARGLSQACVFCIDAKKTLGQVYGKNAPKIDWVQLISKGMATSIITSGAVFGTYYQIYNTIGPQNLWAGPCAALTTSVIKIPISNCMRLMQSGMATSPLHAAKTIYQAQRFRGLYAGYTISLAEDIVEYDTRTRLYMKLKEWTNPTDDSRTTASMRGATLGSLAGVITSWATTPFDTIRTHLAVEAKRTQKPTHKIVVRIVKQQGICGLYRGAVLRATSNAVKSAMFFMFVEALQV